MTIEAYADVIPTGWEHTQLYVDHHQYRHQAEHSRVINTALFYRSIDPCTQEHTPNILTYIVEMGARALDFSNYIGKEKSFICGTRPHMTLLIAL
jgi:hypothetical protein